MKKLLSILTVFMFTVSTFAQLNLKSDAAHSRIQFTVTHLGINDITGNFDKADLTIKADEKNFVNSKLTFSADVNSINTHIEARDNHLKSADFFDAAKFPTMDFTSTSLTKTKKDQYTLKGNLTMHGVTKPVTLTLVYKGSTVNAMNKKTTYGYQVLGTLKRSEFNVGPNFPAPMISDSVSIKGDFELTAE
ncbi:YceI family protein [Kaistella sp.]|uniref:YceI family protein n=1 Tax=Kaistella sp. TaxID=2782235 RepID=UPI002F95D660